MPKKWRDTWVAVETPGTRRGGPSAPQQAIVPSPFRAQVSSPKASIWMASATPWTSTGTGLASGAALPSWPRRLLPQHATWPLGRMAQLWRSPMAILPAVMCPATTPAGRSGGAGETTPASGGDAATPRQWPRASVAPTPRQARTTSHPRRRRAQPSGFTWCGQYEPLDRLIPLQSSWSRASSSSSVSCWPAAAARSRANMRFRVRRSMPSTSAARVLLPPVRDSTRSM